MQNNMLDKDRPKAVLCPTLKRCAAFRVLLSFERGAAFSGVR